MPLALVTGASSGIGRHLAEGLAKRGHDLVLVARSEAELTALKTAWESAYSIVVRVVASDLSAPGAAEQLYAAVRAAGPTPDVLVNNAGFGDVGPFHAADAAHLERMLQLNVLALTRLTHLALVEMRARGSGRILNVASCAGFSAGPLMAVYFATKAYVLHFSEAVAHECAGSGVTVTVLCPGATRTDFHTNAGFPATAKVFNSPFAGDPLHVATYGLRALFAGRRIAVPGFSNRLSLLAIRVLPRRLVAIVTHWALRQ